MMLDATTQIIPLLSFASLAVGAWCFVVGGLRFRRWVVEDRVGVPRFPTNLETVMLWLLYSGFVSGIIITVKQVLRQI